MEIPVLRKPERPGRSSLGLVIFAAFCVGLSAAWLFSKARTRNDHRTGVGSLGNPVPASQPPTQENASGGTTVDGSNIRSRGTVPQAGEPGYSADEASPDSGSSASSASGAAQVEGTGSPPEAPQGSGDASSGSGSGTASSKGGIADGTAPKVPLKWQPPDSVSLKPGQNPLTAGRPGHSSNALPASAKKSKGAAVNEAALLSYLSGLRTQADKFTKEQVRQVQKAIAAEEGRLEQAMANAPAYKPPPASMPLVRGKVWPVQGGGKVSQEFGPTNWEIYAGRTYNGKYYPHFHTGIDIAAPKGTPLRAFDAGKVIYAGGNQQSGVGVIVQHPDGACTTYHHMGLGSAGPTVSVGQYVSAGQTLGYIGMTGMTTGPHVHFMVKYGDLINPRQVLPSK